MLSVMLQLDYTIIEYFSSAPQPERNDSFMTIDSGSDFRDAVTNETGTENCLHFSRTVERKTSELRIQVDFCRKTKSVLKRPIVLNNIQSQHSTPFFLGSIPERRDRHDINEYVTSVQAKQHVPEQC